MIRVTCTSSTIARHTSGLCAGLAALAFMLLAQPAAAADISSALRGTFSDGATAGRWDGLNFGVQFGQSNMNADFSNSTSALLSQLLNHVTIEVEDHVSTWPLLSSNSTNARNYGAFLGYNVQWDQLVAGFDVTYNRLSSMQTDQVGANGWLIHTTNGYDNFYFVSGDASIKLLDYATLRGRAGYAFGQFLPYGFIGAAAGRFNYARSVTVTLSGKDVSGAGGTAYDAGTRTLGNAQDNVVVPGFAAGLGMDVALLPNVFLRGEWEFVAFAPVGGIRANINTGRIGIGAKF